MLKQYHTGNIVAIHNGLTVLDCWQCGYKHLDPLPDYAEIEDYYAQDKFYNGGNNTPDWFIKESVEHSMGLWEPCYDYQIERLNTSLPLLDVGTGCGWFVHYYQYWNQAWGIEPSQSAREAYGMGGYIYPDRATFLAQHGWLAPLNVRMALVLEHLVDPYLEIMQYRELLGTEGRFMVIVPNDFSRLQKKIGGYHWVSKVHLNYFNQDSMTRLLRRAGLKVIDVSVTAPIELNILKGRDYRNDDALGRQCHNERLEFERKWRRKAFQYYKVLYKLLGYGRELIITAERN